MPHLLMMIFQMGPDARNRPSVWFKFGRDVALALGDWLIGLSFKLAVEASDKSGCPQLMHILCEHMMATTRGQAKEFAALSKS